MRTFRQIYESFRFAWQALRANLLRTTLSLLGVTIGIFAIIGVFTLVDSLQRNIRDSLNTLSGNVIYVNDFPWYFGEGEFKWWKYLQWPKIRYAEYRLLSERLENASAVALVGSKGGITIKSGNNSIRGQATGVTYAFNQTRDVVIEDGRYFSPQEIEAARNVVILGHVAAERLFPGQSAVGKSVKISGATFVIIGVQAKKGSGILEVGGNPDRRAIMPYGAYAKLFWTPSQSISIAARAYDSDVNMQALEGEIRGLMRARRSLKPTQEDNFALNRPEAAVKAIEAIFGVLTVAGWVIGSFSILVGGFGIANIMFVSVKERTNLIGIQKSLGAKNYVILFQFLFEAVLLSLVGGLVGILLVYLLSFLQLGSLDIVLSVGNIALGLGVASVIGVASGILPALSAARLDPVIAIRAK